MQYVHIVQTKRTVILLKWLTVITSQLAYKIDKLNCFGVTHAASQILI